MQAIDGSLERLGLDFVDLAVLPPRRSEHADRGDGVGDVATSSRAARRSTGARREWTADEIRAAWDIADRHHLHKPVMEQPQYNLFDRERVEQEYARLYDDIGLGPHDLEPARVGPADRQVPRRHPRGQPGRAARLRVAPRHAHRPGAERQGPQAAGGRRALGCTLSQLAIAWCAANPHVSTVITGASRVEQVRENLGALKVLPQLTPEVLEEIRSIVR